MARSLGRVEKKWRSKAENNEKMVFVLLDPDPDKRELYTSNKQLKDIVGLADTVLVGGSLNVTPYDVEEYIAMLRDLGAETIVIFPGGVSNIARGADAILFMTLLNSVDPYWIIEAQILAAPIVKRLGLEAIPTAYIVYGHGAAAGHIGRALPIPETNPYLVGAYAAAAELLGIRAIYVEAGSGSPKAVGEKAVKAARRGAPSTILIAGGGIRDAHYAKKVLAAGADAIVIGTVVEKEPQKALEIIESAKRS